MSKLFCFVIGLCVLISCDTSAGIDLGSLPVVGPVAGPLVNELTGLVPCLFTCPCGAPGVCVPQLGLAPLLDAHCVDVSLQANLSCPSLSLAVRLCCELQASCYTSCGTGKTVCDLALQACLATVSLTLNLCQPPTLTLDVGLLQANLTLCAKFRDAQKYGCGCSGTTLAPSGK